MNKYNDIVNNFFNTDLPCPTEIHLCEKIREAYSAEVEKAKGSGCGGCAINQIKSKYMEAIWKELSTSTP